MTVYFYFISFVLAYSCNYFEGPQLSEKQILNQLNRIKYDLESPDKKYKLHYDLEEISGLSYYQEGKIACIQDENGILFIYDLEDESIVREIKFAKDGDYEGLTLVKEMAYVIKSNGEISYFKLDPNSEKIDAKKVKTPLSTKNDVEGLCYLKNTDEFLISCKGKGDHGKFDVKGKAFYSLNRTNLTFTPSPVFTIRQSSLEKFFEENKDNYATKHSPELNPSAVAQHPVSGDLFILSAKDRILLITDLDGKIIDLAILNKKLFRQPEGICFDPKGNLFIASEGDGGRGYILQFHHRPS